MLRYTCLVYDMRHFAFSRWHQSCFRVTVLIATKLWFLCHVRTTYLSENELTRRPAQLTLTPAQAMMIPVLWANKSPGATQSQESGLTLYGWRLALYSHSRFYQRGCPRVRQLGDVTTTRSGVGSRKVSHIHDRRLPARPAPLVTTSFVSIIDGDDLEARGPRSLLLLVFVSPFCAWLFEPWFVWKTSDVF